MGVERKGRKDELAGGPAWIDPQDSLDELERLSETAGLFVVSRTLQKLDRVNPATFIGKGKLEEIVASREELDFSVLVFDDELAPNQQRALEESLDENVKVIDRTALILDIFAQHARTREGALQVELAQYEYRLPRLTRMWTHLARQAGGAAGRGGTGGVGLRGPGERQLEIDRREIRSRIGQLKRELEEVRTHRREYRRRRSREGLPVISIVGYTNAGKSTLLNALSSLSEPHDRGQVLAEDKLFATLDPTTRRVKMPKGEEALFTDTVGFIHKLPTQLVAAFRATLEEIGESDLILHVVDMTHPNAQAQVHIVEETLDQIEAGDKPVVLALNKTDRIVTQDGGNEEKREIEQAFDAYSDVVPISALRGNGLRELLECIEKRLGEGLEPVRVRIPYRAHDLVGLFHQRGIIEREESSAQGTFIEGKLPARLIERFNAFLLVDNEG